MPTHLRLFFWLVVAVAAYWVISMLWVMQFPPEAMTAALARLPQAVREQVRQDAWWITLTSTVIRVVVFVGLAWLAAFLRQNWARWAILAILVFMHAAPFAASIYYGRTEEFLVRYADLQADIVTALLVLALVFAFTGDARGAFARANSKPT